MRIKYAILVLLNAIVHLPVYSQNWVYKYTQPNYKLTARAVLPFHGDFLVSYQSIDPAATTYTFTTGLARIDKTGKPLWTRELGNFQGYPLGPFTGLEESQDGNLLFLMGSGSYWGIMKTDTNAKFMWGAGFHMPFGAVYKMAELNNGTIVLAGENDQVNGLSNGFIMFLDKNGKKIKSWNAVAAGNWNSQACIHDIIKTSDGGCIAVGGGSTPVYTNGCVIKMDSAGNVKWVTSFGKNGDNIGIHSIAEDKDGYVYVGSSYPGLVIGKVNKSGVPVWNYTYSGVVVGSPQVRITGTGLRIVSLFQPDIQFTNPMQWAVIDADTLGGITSTRIIPDHYTAQWPWMPAVAFDASGQTIILEQRWQDGFKLIVSDSLHELDVCNAGFMPEYVDPELFKSAGGISFAPATISLQPFYPTSTEIRTLQAKKEFICPNPHPLADVDTEEILVTPNPSGGEFTVSKNSVMNSKEYLVEVYNLVGEKVYSEKISTSSARIKLEGQPKGLYLVDITIGNERKTTKMIVE